MAQRNRENVKCSNDLKLYSGPKSLFHLQNSGENNEIEFRYQGNKLQIKQETSEIQSSNSAAQIVSDISNFPKIMKTVTLITIQTCSRGKTKTEFMDPNNFRQDKRRVQTFKNLGKQLQLQQLATTW